MRPKDIYELETIDSSLHWADSHVFFCLTEKDIDDDPQLFSYDDAIEDIRIAVLLKAEVLVGDLDSYVAYWVITFDGKPIAIVRLCGSHQDLWDKYITDYPLYQAMIGYVKAMFTPGQSEIVVDENEEVEDLESLYGWEIDKEVDGNLRREE